MPILAEGAGEQSECWSNEPFDNLLSRFRDEGGDEMSHTGPQMHDVLLEPFTG
jgi:hypothetical protein